MTRLKLQFRLPAALGGATGSDVAVWVRLMLLVGAILFGALAYHHHLAPELPWWRWLVELVVGCTLLTLSLRGEGPPAETRLRRWTRRAAGVGTMVATAVAIHLFSQPGRELATGIAIGVAVGAFAVARWLPFASEDIRALIGDPTDPDEKHPPLTVARSAAVLAGMASAVAAASANATHHLAGSVLWLASLGLFAAAMWQRGAVESDRQPPQRWVGAGGPQLSRRWEAVLFALIMLVALALRVTSLKDAPAAIEPDEGRQGRYAERIWQEGFPDAFGLGWNVFPNLSYMVEYAWVQVRGTSNANLRLSAATIGVLSLIPVFFWARRWWGNIIALLTVSLLAINWEHMAWSRVALNNIQQVLVAGLMLATFARVLRTRRWVDWVWFGYATGLAFHTYHAAKLFPALLAAVAVLFALGIRSFTRRYLGGALVGALALLLCLGPLTVTVFKNWGQFYAGISNRSDLERLIGAYRRADIPEVRGYLRSHVYGCLLSFTSIPSPRAATFDPFVAVPFLLGLGWMLWRWRDPRHLVVLVWTAGILMIGGMMTDYPPWKARLLGFLPTVCVIPAVVVGRIRETLYRWAPERADLIAVPVLLLWMGASLQRNWSTEFTYWPARQRGEFMTEMCRVIDNTRLPATFYLSRGRETVELKVAINDCMIAANRERFLVNLPDDPAIVPIPPTNRGTAVLLVAPDQRELLPLIRHYYPAAQYDVVHDQAGTATLHIFTLREDEIERSRGLRATYRSPKRTWSSEAGTASFVAPAGAEFPLSATWRGQLWIPTPGIYAFRSIGGQVRMDGVPGLAGGTRGLTAGWHLAELTARFTRPSDGVVLEWQPPNATEWSPIPRASLHTHPETHGLLGRYFGRLIEASSAAPITVSPNYTRVDTALSFHWQPQWDSPPPEPFAARPSTMEWTGTVEMPEGGDSQGIRLEATAPAQMFINGMLVLSTRGEREGQAVEAEVARLKGPVPILVRTMRPADDDSRFWKLRVLWRDPGGEWTAFVRYHPSPAEGF